MNTGQLNSERYNKDKLLETYKLNSIWFTLHPNLELLDTNLRQIQLYKISSILNKLALQEVLWVPCVSV